MPECRKIPPCYENPLDNVLIDVCDLFTRDCHCYGLTPNMITLFNIVLRIILIYLLIDEKYFASCILFIISYMLDILDGCFARKYNQESDLGDKLDHYSDYIFYFILIFVIYLKTNNKLLLIIYLIISFASMVHFGCQELIYQGPNSIVSTFKKFCPDKNLIRYTKYLGSGTFNLFVLLNIVFIKTL
jgi:hypothetical protein